MAFLVSLRDLYVLPFSRRKDNLYESVKKFVKTRKEDLNAYFTASLRIRKFIISILQLPFRVINVTCKCKIEPVFQFLNLSFLSLNRLSSTALSHRRVWGTQETRKSEGYLESYKRLDTRVGRRDAPHLYQEEASLQSCFHRLVSDHPLHFPFTSGIWFFVPVYLLHLFDHGYNPLT